MADERTGRPLVRTRAPAIRGRDSELAILRSVISRASVGHAGGALIEGDAGIGKSRLIAEAIAEARAEGFTAFLGAASDLTRDRPFSAVAHALLPMRDVLPESLWGGLTSDLSSDAHGISEQVFDVLEARSLLSRVLVCLEDLHWADDATLVFVQTAFQRMEGLPLALLATFRPSHAEATIAHLVDRLTRRGVGFVRLGPLDDRAVDEIAREALDADPGPTLRAELRRAAGSPLYVLELISALDEDGAITRRGDEAEVVSPTVPPTLRLTILRRIASMPRPTVELLRHASVLGPIFDVGDLAIVTASSGVELLDALDPARRSGVLVPLDDDRLGFAHDLVRTAIYDDIPSPVRRTLHRDAADALAAAGRPIDLVALHMSAGAAVGDRAAVDSLRRAAATARRSSLRVADDLLQRAVELCTEDDPTRDELQAERVSLLTLTFRPREAEALAHEVLARPISLDLACTVRSGLSRALAAQSRNIEAEELQASIASEARAPSDLRTSAQVSLAFLAFQRGDKDTARERLATAKAEPSALQHAATQLSIIELYLASADGFVDEALRSGLESLRRSESLTVDDRDRLMTLNSTDPVLTVHLAAAAGLLQADRDPEALRHLRQAQELTELRRTNWAVQVQTGIAVVLYGTAELDDALVEAEAALREAEGSSLGILTAYGLAARIHLHRGDVARARELVDLGEAEIVRSGPSLGADIFGWASALTAEAEGDTATALATLELVWLATEPFRYLFGYWRFIWPDLVRLALDGGRDELAREVMAASEAGAARARHVASVRGAAARIRGLVGDPAALVDAVEAYRSSPRRIGLALTLADAGRVLGRAGDDRAPALLTEALETFEAIGASRDADRTASILRDLGIRRGRRGPRGRPTVGWGALTPSELRIAELVAEGLTNATIGDRLFISRRTVQTHLRSVFSKLGMTTRAELAAEVVRRRI